jgi:glutamate-1-semialdehyde 2,1-aminomutase
MSMTQPEISQRVRRSMELYERATKLIPGATQLISRRPSQLAFGVSPVFACHAKGARIWDVDGNEYIDWLSGIRTIILGYADPVVDEAVHQQIDKGTITSLNHELELELAEELIATIPCAEMVRYAKGGGEACTIAVRIARGVTGRDKILFSGYHGWHDWYLAANLSSDSILNEYLLPGIEPIGVPRCLEGTTMPFPYGDLNALGEALDNLRGEVAAVILEPMRSEMPPEGYLEGVAKLAKEHDVLLIFDEVSTGFRLSAGGVQPALGVVPDMAVFAKSLSNGYPMGVVVGKREVMEPVARMFISSTYWSDTVGIQAALTTLREIRKRDIPTYLDRIGSELKTGINSIAVETGLAVSCEGINSTPYLRFDIQDTQLLKKVSTLYIQEMAKRSCHGNTTFCPNGSTGAKELNQTFAAVLETFTLIEEGLRNNRIDDLLQCEIQQSAFRRLVQ